MTVKLIHKTRSERGASLSMALLLMLVCVMVASVSLTAASASAGRLSQLKETDENYYNVTSAAKMFWTLMKTDTPGVNTKIERSCTVSGTAGSWEYSSCSYKINDRVVEGPFRYDEVNPNVTLFEAVASDAVLNKHADIAETDIAETFNTGSVEPEVKDPDYSVFENTEYTIELTPPNALGKVNVSIKRQENSIFEFQFKESVEHPMSYCTLYARLNVSTPLPEINGDRYTFTTDATWDPLYISVGDA